MSRRMRNVLVSVSLLAGLLLVTHGLYPIPNVPRLPKLQSPFVSEKGEHAHAQPQVVSVYTEQRGKIPRRIWQTWRDPPQNLADDYKGWTLSWHDKNPGYRYELLTDEAALTFVQTAFWNRPDILDAFIRTEDIILRADYVRYLALYAEGGIYTDMDTDCTKPIDEWIPEEYANSTGFVVGVEYDALDGDIRADFEDRVQLCQWAFMSRAGNQVLGHIIDRVTKALLDLAPDGGRIIVKSNDDVLHVTGPRIFSYAILEQLSTQLGRPVTQEDIGFLEKPKQIGDTLILPINAFGSGQIHSNSGEEGNDGQYLWHHFNGFWGWKDAHDGERDREKEAAEKEAAEKADEEDRKKHWEGFKNLVGLGEGEHDGQGLTPAEQEARDKEEAEKKLEAAASAVVDYMAIESPSAAATVTVVVTAPAEEHTHAARAAVWRA